VALTRGMSATVQPLLDPDSVVMDPGLANCAIFYSITNCVPSLRGVSFGNLLIKQVVEDLKQTFPKLATFATLSPIPDFRKWLIAALESSSGPRLAGLAAVVNRLNVRSPGAEVAITPPVRQELLRVCAHYLLKASRGKAPLDAVARFHLANGARLERLNWMGDTSEIGMRRSFGLMANYVYRLPDLERNHEAYASRYKLAASREMERLAADSPLKSPTVPALRAV
jgi:malonyl-CoA decarboxylase